MREPHTCLEQVRDHRANCIVPRLARGGNLPQTRVRTSRSEHARAVEMEDSGLLLQATGRRRARLVERAFVEIVDSPPTGSRGRLGDASGSAPAVRIYWAVVWPSVPFMAAPPLDRRRRRGRPAFDAEISWRTPSSATAGADHVGTLGKAARVPLPMSGNLPPRRACARRA